MNTTLRYLLTVFALPLLITSPSARGHTGHDPIQYQELSDDVMVDISMPGGWSLYNCPQDVDPYITDRLNIHFVQHYETADSIVRTVEYIPQQGLHENRDIHVTINNPSSDIDYYVLEIERNYNQYTDAGTYRFIEAFPPDVVEMSMPTEYIDLYKDGGVGYEPERWTADPAGFIPPFCTADSIYSDTGEFQYAIISLLWGSFHPKPSSYLEAHVLSPQSICVFWNDTLTDNSSYKLEVEQWHDEGNEWVDEVTFTMPPDFAAYCVNDLQPESTYRLTLFPEASSECSDTTFCIAKTLANTDLLETDLLHQLPYAPITGFTQENNLLAYTLVYGWKKNETYYFYDHLLIKQPDGHFSIHELARAQDADAFHVMDLEAHNQSVYVAHSNQDIIKVTLNPDVSVSKENLNLDLQGGYPKQIEDAGDTLYIANKFNSIDPSGSQPALGILDLNTEALSLHTHPNIASGADLLTVGENRVWLAENDLSGSEMSSSIVRLRRDGSLDAPFFGELTTTASRSGIIDLKVNPDTGELVYLSPTYGLHGSYGNDYNSDLQLPDGLTLDDVSCLNFDISGNLIIAENSACMAHTSPSTLETIISDAFMDWQEMILSPGNDFIGLAPVLLVLPQVTVTPQLVIGGLTLYAIGSYLITQSQTIASVDFTAFRTGVKDKTVDKKTAIDFDFDEFRRRYKQIMDQQKTNPGTLPNLDPIAFPKLGDPVVPPDPDPPEEPHYDLVLGKSPVMLAPNRYFHNMFIDSLRMGGYIQPPDKEVFDYKGVVQAYLTWTDYITLNAPRYGIDLSNPEILEHWTHPTDIFKSAFYLYSVFADKIHFLYKEVDIAKVLLHPDDIKPKVPTITEWELAQIEKQEVLWQKLQCYNYGMTLLGRRILVKIGECRACLDYDLLDDIKTYSTSHQFDFSETTSTSGNLVLASTEEERYLTLQTEIGQENDQFELNDLNLSLWNPAEELSFAPHSVSGSQYTFRLPIQEIPDWAEMSTVGQTAQDDTVHSWFYYRLYEGVSLLDSTTYAYEPDAAYFQPSNTMRNTASIVFFGEYLHRLLGEPDGVQRESYTFYIESDAPVNGTINIFYDTFDLTSPLSICRWSPENSDWFPLRTELDSENGLASATIYQDGAYALCNIQGPQFPPPIAWYSFDDSSIADQSGNNLDGWTTDTVTYGKGIVALAAFLDGQNDDGDEAATPDGIYLPDNALFDPANGFSIAFWIKPLTNSGSQLVLQKDTESSSYRIDILNGQLRATVKGLTGEGPIPFSVSSDITASQWSHVAITVQNGSLRLYINGTCVDYDDYIPATLHSNLSTLRLGFSAEREAFQGWIDELLFYDYAISETDVGNILSQGNSILNSVTLYGRLWAYGLMNGYSQSTRLNANGVLPHQSPFATSIPTPESLADSLVDWVWIELLETPDSEPVLQQSAFLSQNGFLCDGYGACGCSLEIQPGSYVVRINHRNHLPLQTASAIELAPGDITFVDFTQNSTGTCPNGMGQLGTGEYAMVPGDINNDGIINTRDYTIWYNQQLASPEGAGYLSGDLNGDGYVDNEDFELWHQTSTGNRTFVLPSQEE
jgi:hypothetical protein